LRREDTDVASVGLRGVPDPYKQSNRGNIWSVVFKAPGRMDILNPLTLVTKEYCQLCTKLLTGGRTPINLLLADQDGIKFVGK